MQLVDGNKPLKKSPLVASIGFFDGVHLGHRYLIQQIKQKADEKDMLSAVITFPVHPRKILQTDYQPALLCGYEERVNRLATTGLDLCISLDFTSEISHLSAREFIHKILKERYNVDTLLIGYDHRFGHNREDGFEEYQKYGTEEGLDIIQAKEFEGEHISSSRIRMLLKEGDVQKAAELLSYNYQISGKIVEGFKVGRTIGFPTANIQSWEQYKVIPAFGVYAVFVYIDEVKYGGMLYIGKRPTLHNGENVSVEVNVFDFEGDLYNKSLTVEFLEFVRPDQKFDGLEILRAQLYQDQENVSIILKKYF